MARLFLSRRAAFSLVEVLVSLTILGMAAAALLLTNETMSLRSRDAISRTIAQGLAEQLLNDLAGMRYCERGESPFELELGPETGELASPIRTILFDDLDDFHRLDLAPPADAWGVGVGQGDETGKQRPVPFRVPDGYFANWRVTVFVSYASETDPSVDLAGSATSGLRAATVTVTRTVNGETDQLARVRRVFAYVPPL